MRVAYLDCIGGIAGDMLLAALIDAGVDAETLAAGLRSLPLGDWELRIEPRVKLGIRATGVEVVVRGVEAGPAPLMQLPPYDAPREEPGAPPPGDAHPGHTHHAAAGAHAHGHGIGRAAGAVPHPPARRFTEVTAAIRASTLPAPVKERAQAVFQRLAEAEAKVHGVPLEMVHFHEVGAVDSIVDVVGSVYGLHLLGVERVVCSPLPVGSGFVACAHGSMPVPAPATLELLRGVPLRETTAEGELTTPTGAALAVTLSERFGPLPGFTVRSAGYGAGRRDLPFPNVLRLILGEEATHAPAATVALVEANLDDQSPQLFESAQAALFEAGALDVWVTPILMKKGRPAHALSVLCEPSRVEAIAAILFAETTTLGVRHTEWKRVCLPREWLEVTTPFGPVRVKIGRHEGRPVTVMPEYEDCRARAREAGVPVKQVQQAAAAAAWGRLFPE